MHARLSVLILAAGLVSCADAPPPRSVEPPCATAAECKARFERNSDNRILDAAASAALAGENPYVVSQQLHLMSCQREAQLWPSSAGIAADMQACYKMWPQPTIVQQPVVVQQQPGYPPAPTTADCVANSAGNGATCTLY